MMNFTFTVIKYSCNRLNATTVTLLFKYYLLTAEMFWDSKFHISSFDICRVYCTTAFSHRASMMPNIAPSNRLVFDDTKPSAQLVLIKFYDPSASLGFNKLN